MSSDNTLSALATLDETVLAEVVREGEATVQAQLTVSLAADQRALVVGGIVLTGGTAALGGVAALAQQAPIPWALIPAAGLLALGLFVSGAIALAAARPTRFCLPGNEPANWLPSKWSLPANKPRTLLAARVEQACVLQSHIRKNRTSAADSAKWLRRSLATAYLSVVLAGGLLAGAVAHRALNTTSPSKQVVVQLPPAH